ncbi:hypothetical protein I4U23_010983 [Adineta vaga]|nr:hypothetical protein I4U23_010983 [Adineta vaga]
MSATMEQSATFGGKNYSIVNSISIKRDIDGTRNDDEFISEIVWVVCISLARIHLYKALGFNVEEFQPLMKYFIYKAVNTEVSLLYYIRYEPTNESQTQLSSEDPKFKYINKIVAVNLRRDQFDVDKSGGPIGNATSKIIVNLIDGARNIYMKYLEETIIYKTKLDYLLKNRNQILYLSIGSVLVEFYNQVLYKWFRPLVMEHIQSRYNFKRSYGISLSAASAHVLEKDGYICVGKINSKICEWLDQTTSDLLKNIDDDLDDISILEKIHVQF